VGECATSNEDGEYTIAGIPPGEWRVGFDAGRPFQVQFYDGVSEFSAAAALSVASGTTITKIDAAMLVPSTEPVSSPPHGSQPTQPPQGPGSSTTTATTTTTTSSGVLGTSSAKAAPTVSLASSTLTLSGHAVRAGIVCDSQPCSGSIVLRVQIAVRGQARGERHQRMQTLILGRGSFALAPGARGSVLIDLTRAGARMFARAGAHARLLATLSIVVHGGSSLTRSVRIASVR